MDATKPDNVFVVYQDMDTMVHEQIFENPDNTYTIFLNSRINIEMQKQAYLHALSHITNKDFEKIDCDIIERNAHGMEVSMELCPI